MAENDGVWGERCNDQPVGGAATAKAGLFCFHANAALTSMLSGKTTLASGGVPAGSSSSFAHCNEGEEVQLSSSSDDNKDNDEDYLGRGHGGGGASDPPRQPNAKRAGRLRLPGQDHPKATVATMCE